MSIPTFVEVTVTKNDVLETIQAEWSGLYALALPLTDQLHLSPADHLETLERLESLESLESPGSEEGQEHDHGAWNIKDTLAHVCWGERWLAGQVGLPVRKLPPPDPTLDLADPKQRDVWFYHLDHLRPLEEVLAEGRAIHSALMGRLQHLSEAKLNTPFHINPHVPPPEYSEIEAQWRPLWPLWRWVVSMTYDRYRQHLPTLQTWFTTAEDAHQAGNGRPVVVAMPSPVAVP